MPRPAHKRVQFQGQLLQAVGGGSDIFEFGWADSSALSLEALATAMAGVMSTAWEDASLDTGCSTHAVLNGCRTEQVAVDGSVTGSYFVAISPVNGLNSNMDVTLLCQAVTLETSTPDDHGRMVRGRFFPPGMAPGFLGSTTTPTEADLFASSWATVLSRAVTAGGQPAVASVTGGGQIADVTAVSSGTVADTQRRRKNHVTVQRSAKHNI